MANAAETVTPSPGVSATRRRKGLGVTIAQWAHLLGAGLAAGTMVFLIVALFPSLGSIGSEEAGTLMEALVWRIRYIFWTAILLLSLGGLYLTVVASGIRSFRQLFATSYGRLLAVKIALALVVSTLALLLTLPLSVLAPLQQNTPAILPFVLLLAVVVVLLGAVLRRL